jgi:hypothetical protein
MGGVFIISHKAGAQHLLFDGDADAEEADQDKKRI